MPPRPTLTIQLDEQSVFNQMYTIVGGNLVTKQIIDMGSTMLLGKAVNTDLNADCNEAYIELSETAVPSNDNDIQTLCLQN